MEAEGMDSEGRGFRNVGEMWREIIGCDGVEEQKEDSSTVQSTNKRQEWYRKGIAYWQGVDASVNGVLGGYGHVNDADVKGSEDFLQPLLAERFGGGNPHVVALDCGSGIGRVTKNVLIRYFNEVDLVEPVSHFLDAARKNLAPDNYIAEGSHKAANFYCVPLQDFAPERERYDVIWIQWCIGQLPDDDFVAFFKRAKMGLKPNGFFVLKENIAKSGFVLDNADQSVTRSDGYFRQLFQRCGLQIYKTKDQKGLPRELFAVKMYALVPISTANTTRKVKRKSQTWATAIIKS